MVNTIAEDAFLAAEQRQRILYKCTGCILGRKVSPFPVRNQALRSRHNYSKQVEKTPTHFQGVIFSTCIFLLSRRYAKKKPVLLRLCI